jgi:DNA-binding LacI/PurR family transcriptional regulator
MFHTAVRDAAFRPAGTIVAGDYTGTSGAALTRRLLESGDRPTAIVYDNDVMAVAGLGVARELGFAVPGDLSIVASEDSPLCRLVGPPLTVLKRDLVGYGRQATELLFERIETGERRARQAETPHLVIRGST